VEEALELRREGEVDHHDGQEESKVERGSRFLELPRLPRQLGGEPLREVLIGDGLELIEDRAQGGAMRDAPLDGGGALPLVVVELPRGHRLPHLDEARELHHLVVRPAHVKALEVGGGHPVHIAELDLHVVLLGPALEVGEILASQEDL
jgi:hypothetical protein